MSQARVDRVARRVGRGGAAPASPLRLVAVAALLALLALGALAVGAEVLRQQEDPNLSVVPPVATASPPATPSPTPTPSRDRDAVRAGAQRDATTRDLRGRTRSSRSSSTGCGCGPRRPSTRPTSAKLEPLLGNGTKLQILDGPVTADDYDWYLVQAIGWPHHGWVAAADHDGSPWIVASDAEHRAGPGQDRRRGRALRWPRQGRLVRLRSAADEPAAPARPPASNAMSMPRRPSGSASTASRTRRPRRPPTSTGWRPTASSPTAGTAPPGRRGRGMDGWRGPRRRPDRLLPRRERHREPAGRLRVDLRRRAGSRRRPQAHLPVGLDVRRPRDRPGRRAAADLPPGT